MKTLHIIDSYTYPSILFTRNKYIAFKCCYNSPQVKYGKYDEAKEPHTTRYNQHRKITLFYELYPRLS